MTGRRYAPDTTTRTRDRAALVALMGRWHLDSTHARKETV